MKIDNDEDDEIVVQGDKKKVISARENVEKISLENKIEEESDALKYFKKKLNEDSKIPKSMDSLKIKVCHLLTLPDTQREIESVISISQLANYGITYSN
jgi:hypothetical protein